jgi:hypothetical protein
VRRWWTIWLWKPDTLEKIWCFWIRVSVERLRVKEGMGGGNYIVVLLEKL